MFALRAVGSLLCLFLERPQAGGWSAPPPLDRAKLQQQREMMFMVMTSSLSRIELYTDEERQVKATTFWTRLASRRSLKIALSEWLKAASIALVMVTGSTEDERAFSTLSFVKDDLRNRLTGSNFNAAMFLAVQRIYSPYTFPYRDAIMMWHQQQARRPAAGQAPAERPLSRPAYKSVVDFHWGPMEVDA